jgi:hypothetical protein
MSFLTWSRPTPRVSLEVQIKLRPDGSMDFKTIDRRESRRACGSNDSKAAVTISCEGCCDVVPQSAREHLFLCSSFIDYA